MPVSVDFQPLINSITLYLASPSDSKLQALTGHYRELVLRLNGMPTNDACHYFDILPQSQAQKIISMGSDPWFVSSNLKLSPANQAFVEQVRDLLWVYAYRTGGLGDKIAIRDWFKLAYESELGILASKVEPFWPICKLHNLDKWIKIGLGKVIDCFDATKEKPFGINQRKPFLGYTQDWRYRLECNLQGESYISWLVPKALEDGCKETKGVNSYDYHVLNKIQGIIEYYLRYPSTTMVGKNPANDLYYYLNINDQAQQIAEFYQNSTISNQQSHNRLAELSDGDNVLAFLKGFLLAKFRICPETQVIKDALLKNSLKEHFLGYKPVPKDFKPTRPSSASRPSVGSNSDQALFESIYNRLSPEDRRILTLFFSNKENVGAIAIIVNKDSRYVQQRIDGFKTEFAEKRRQSKL